mmetsp:Transcript_39017/g.63227  ORF Transcript_39017/g.63227 Transcript_39017/m.63227 type:complete len:153 (+) Transcript_39017:493-951(+)
MYNLSKRQKPHAYIMVDISKGQRNGHTQGDRVDVNDVVVMPVIHESGRTALKISMIIEGLGYLTPEYTPPVGLYQPMIGLVCPVALRVMLGREQTVFKVIRVLLVSATMSVSLYHRLLVALVRCHNTVTFVGVASFVGLENISETTNRDACL